MKTLIHALVLLMFTVTAQAAFITSTWQICQGFYGSSSSLSMACSGGGPVTGGGGGIIGGSGVGSGYNVPFSTDSSHNSFSASVAGLQDFGIFHGFANVSAQDQQPNLFGGLYSARATGQFEDTWTIPGTPGQGKLRLSFTITGGGTATQIVVGGNGSESAQANFAINASTRGTGLDGESGTTGPLNSSGIYPVLINGLSNGFTFNFNVPFTIDVVSIVTAGGSYDPYHPPSFYSVDASASFEHTATLTGITATDLAGNPISNFTLVSESGTVYPLVAPNPGAVPEPSTFLLAGLCLIPFAFRSRIPGVR